MQHTLISVAACHDMPDTATYCCTAEVRRRDRLLERAKLKTNPELAAKLAESRLQPVTYRTESPTLAPAIQVVSLTTQI